MGKKYAKMIFKQAVTVISGNLNRAFDLSRPCALCGKVGHSFDDCKELKDPAAIRKANIPLCIGLQKLKGIATSQRCDINFIQSYKISYVNSVDLLPPSSPSLDPAANDRLDTLERMLVNIIRATRLTNSKINSLNPTDDDDDDDDSDKESQSSLNRRHIQDFLKGTLK